VEKTQHEDQEITRETARKTEIEELAKNIFCPFFFVPMFSSFRLRLVYHMPQKICTCLEFISYWYHSGTAITTLYTCVTAFRSVVFLLLLLLRFLFSITISVCANNNYVQNAAKHAKSSSYDGTTLKQKKGGYRKFSLYQPIYNL
jgi:hypothetical protein